MIANRCLIAAIALASAPSYAATVTYVGTSGLLSASATFSQSAAGAPLVVQLTNASTADVLVPADVLTSIFFTLSPGTTLTPLSAVLAPGSVVVYDPDGQPASGVVGGEFAFKAGLTGAPASAALGISSSGLGLFGPGDLFPGSDLAPPTSPDGPNYGILSAGDNALTGNNGVLNAGGMIKNSVIFTFNTAANFLFTPSNLSSVSFQYGTALSEPNVAASVTPVPEPGSWISVAAGLGVIALYLRRRSPAQVDI